MFELQSSSITQIQYDSQILDTSYISYTVLGSGNKNNDR